MKIRCLVEIWEKCCLLTAAAAKFWQSSIPLPTTEVGRNARIGKRQVESQGSRSRRLSCKPSDLTATTTGDPIEFSLQFRGNSERLKSISTTIKTGIWGNLPLCLPKSGIRKSISGMLRRSRLLALDSLGRHGPVLSDPWCWTIWWQLGDAFKFCTVSFQPNLLSKDYGKQCWRFFFLWRWHNLQKKKSSLASSKDGSALFGLLEAFTREFAARHGALIQGQWVAREAVKSQEAKLKFSWENSKVGLWVVLKISFANMFHAYLILFVCVTISVHLCCNLYTYHI